MKVISVLAYVFCIIIVSVNIYSCDAECKRAIKAKEYIGKSIYLANGCDSMQIVGFHNDIFIFNNGLEIECSKIITNNE